MHAHSVHSGMQRQRKNLIKVKFQLLPSEEWAFPHPITTCTCAVNTTLLRCRNHPLHFCGFWASLYFLFQVVIHTGKSGALAEDSMVLGLSSTTATTTQAKTGCNFRLLKHRMGIRVLKDSTTALRELSLHREHQEIPWPACWNLPAVWECTVGQDCSKGAVVTAGGVSKRRRKLWRKQACLWFLRELFIHKQ